MTRLALPAAAAIATLCVAAPVVAADYSDPFGSGNGGLRTGFSNSWDNSDLNDPLSFELGVRYWYSWGVQSFSAGTADHGTMNESDHSQSAEAHFRIDDSSSKYYAKGLAGMAFTTDGSSSDNNGTIAVTNGKVAYAGADIGYSWLGDGKNTSFGPFAGYMYWNDSPNTYADNYTTATSAGDITFDPTTGQTSFPGASMPNDIELNMLRLGVSGKMKLGSMFDVSGEVAAVPYAKISGVLGAGSGFSTGAAVNYDNSSGVGPTGPTGAYNIHDIQSSPTSIDGWGYGAMAEAMVGFHPTSSMTLRLGGRAWYVQGTADATFTRAQIGDPTDSTQPTAGPPVNLNPPNFDTPPTFSNQAYITRANPFSVFRYGLLAELTYNF